MSTFRHAVESRASAPPRVVEVPPDAWATSYPQRPSEVVRMGLRRYSEGDARACAAAAEGIANRLHPAQAEDPWVEAYNGALMALIVARSVCDAEDASIPYWERGADDLVRIALTPQGIELLYSEIDRMTVEDSPIAPEADDADLAWLADALATGAPWRSMSVDATTRSRRLLAYAVAAMRP